MPQLCKKNQIVENEKWENSILKELDSIVEF